jgi:hypothetical protein
VFKERVGAIITTSDTPETSDEWIPKENDLYEITIPVGRITDTIRLNLAVGENAIYDRLLIYVDEVTRLESLQRVDVEVKTFLDRIDVIEDVHFVTGKKEKIAAGMSGSLIYQSELSRKICRIDIVCDSNARARLLNEGFDWQEEDLGTLVYWRGINIIEAPTYITEYIFDFGGTDAEGNWINEGIVFSTHFYEEVQKTEYDSPIVVRFAIDVNRNVQEGIFYYIDDNGREHCIAVNEIQFTKAEYEHLQHDPAMRIAINLETVHGRISCTCPGAINIECLPDI